MYEILKEPLSPILILDWDVKDNLTVWLPGFLTGKKKNRKIQWNYTLRNVSQTHLYWRLCCGDIIIIIPLSDTKVKLHVFPKELFHYAKFVHYLNQDTKA